MKIILVTNNSIYGRYFASEIARLAAPDQIIIETGRPSNKFYVNKLRKVGPLNFVFQYWLNLWFAREGARNLPDMILPEHIEVENINRHQLDPEDLLIGFGTSYITPKTLKRQKNGFLNLHTGLLPEYRGVKSEFWALYNRDYKNAGWTLHYMVSRLDAGDIIIRQKTEATVENPGELRCKIIQEAVLVIAEFIGRVRSEGIESIQREPQDETKARYYTTPTYGEWRRYRKQSGLK
nr:hypothetical protein [candidate division Zixibacteria bacterium]